jgi:hypothetical protein
MDISDFESEILKIANVNELKSAHSKEFINSLFLVFKEYGGLPTSLLYFAAANIKYMEKMYILYCDDGK